MQYKKVSNIYGQVYSFAKESVTSLEQIYPGDHLAYERVKLYWHHIIVEDIDSDTQDVKVIHYYNDVKGFFETTFNQGSIAQVMRGSLKFWSNRFYRIVYDENVVNLPEKVLELARARLGETRYCPLKHNCEHFCTECKIGERLSIQVETLVENMLVSLLPPLTRILLEQLLKKAIQESIKELSKDATRRVGEKMFIKLSRIVLQIAMMRCIGFVGSRTTWVLLQQNTCSIVKDVMVVEAQNLLITGTKEVLKSATRNVSPKGISDNLCPRRVRCRITKSGILAGVAVELAFVGKDIRDASKKKNAGEISKVEFEETVIKRVVGASVSAPMSLVGSVVGQYVLPVPVLGNLIGGIAGSAAGRVVGAVLSTTVIKTRSHVGKLMKLSSWKR